MKPLRGRVVVVTGASSGLGRAIAIELAGRGCALVLAARGRDALEAVARQCEELGARTLVVQTDVTRHEEVDALAAATLEAFDRIDVWINNAGVTYYSFLEDGVLELHERVIQTNLLGSVYGARAVVPVFRRQHEGVLINVGSVLSEVGQAFVPSYVISKFGVHGLTEALRVELADERDIHACTIFPFAIDTPHFQSAANAIGKAPRSLPPMQPPEKVARAVARLIEYPRRTTFVPKVIRLGLLLHMIMPRAVEHLLLDTLRRWHISDRPELPSTGNLYAPGEDQPHGDRPPMISTPRLLAWAAMRFARNQISAVAHRLRPTPKPQLQGT
ncbi:MAG TPA: SDR family NAD(P)-dependent oxidoreductase [Kofleriaceae bacterium]|nr:SDR family NAD(P)-dependent oxidoreductase [Kofleriaceae bacterium]